MMMKTHIRTNAQTHTYIRTQKAKHKNAKIHKRTLTHTHLCTCTNVGTLTHSMRTQEQMLKGLLIRTHVRTQKRAFMHKHTLMLYRLRYEH